MIREFKNTHISELAQVAEWLKSRVGDRRVVLFDGHMGAGKTTFIKIFCQVMGVADEVSSPTFSLVNEYITSGGLPIYHFDFYRLEDIEEAYDMGYEEYLYSDGICLIEWPERISELLPEEVITFEIAGIGDTRNIKIEY